MGIEAGDSAAIEAFRALVFRGVKEALEFDGHHKSYEGRVGIVYPSYFDATEPETEDKPFVVVLDCYVLGPHRHYEWRGATLDWALRLATADVEEWIAENVAAHDEARREQAMEVEQQAEEAFARQMNEVDAVAGSNPRKS